MILITWKLSLLAFFDVVSEKLMEKNCGNFIFFISLYFMFYVFLENVGVLIVCLTPILS